MEPNSAAVKDTRSLADYVPLWELTYVPVRCLFTQNQLRKGPMKVPGGTPLSLLCAVMLAMASLGVELASSLVGVLSRTYWRWVEGTANSGGPVCYPSRLPLPGKIPPCWPVGPEMKFRKLGHTANPQKTDVLSIPAQVSLPSSNACVRRKTFSWKPLSLGLAYYTAINDPNRSLLQKASTIGELSQIPGNQYLIGGLIVFCLAPIIDFSLPLLLRGPHPNL